MAARVLVVGGYGGVGKALAKCLARYSNYSVIIGGPNIQKGRALKNEIASQFPHADIREAYLDATDKNSLLENFKQVDLAIVTATLPDHMEGIAEVALESNIDLLDILIRGDVVDVLRKYENTIKKNNRIFLTQCGFHPGLIAPMIKRAGSYFDNCDEARVFMAMEGVFEQPEAIKEILYEVITPNAQILENGCWKKVDHKSALPFKFSAHFGKRVCYPVQMREIHGVEKELGLRHCGVYASGFDSYIDNFVFPLAFVLGRFNKKLSLNISSQLFFGRVRQKNKRDPKVELVLVANGSKKGKPGKITLRLKSDDSFELTAFALLALLDQYFDGSISRPGLYLMGQVIDAHRLFEDLKNRGISLQTEESTGNGS